MSLQLKLVHHQEKDADGRHYSRDTYSVGSYQVQADDTTLENGSTLRSISV